MTKINISKIATILLLSTSALIAKEATETSYAQIVTEITEKNSTVNAIEKTIEPVAQKVKVVSEKTIEPVAQKVEVVAEKTIEPVAQKVEVLAEKTIEPVAQKVEVVSEKTIEPVAQKVEVVSEKTVEPVAEIITPKLRPKTPKQTNTQESTIIITMPAVPKPPKVTVIVPKLIVLDSEGNLVTKESIESLYVKKKVVFSNRVAPHRFNENVEHKKVELLAGDIVDSRVPAYLHSAIISVDEAKAKLQKAGFDILSTFKVDKKGKVISIIFTNDAIIKAASKSTRGFAASLRIVLDTKNKLTVISNPIYLMKAFMQKGYNKELAVATLLSLRNVFEDAKNSQEMIKFRTLERFHFMENMPYYQDMKQIATGKNKDLLKKAKKSKKIVFEQHLANGSILLGVKLGKRTSKFVKKIGYQNSGLLPYPVLIENGKAKILAPQYYIAVMYPQLKMSQFMKIATVPGAITKDIDKVFR